jgi:hypothetical protein
MIHPVFFNGSNRSSGKETIDQGVEVSSSVLSHPAKSAPPGGNDAIVHTEKAAHSFTIQSFPESRLPTSDFNIRYWLVN